jgi:broad specificity phosphatase PhoE
MRRTPELIRNPKRMTDVFIILHEKCKRPSELEYEYMTGKLKARIDDRAFGGVLMPDGRRRARALGRKLAGLDLAAIYVDDFIVARETARLIARGTGAEPAITVATDRRLCESDLSYLTRRRFQELGKREANGDPNATIRDWVDRCSEDFASLVSQHVDIWNEIVTAHEGQKVAIVLHVEGFLLYPALLLGLAPEQIVSLHIPRDHPVHVRLFADRPPLVSFGDDSYWLNRPTTIFGQYS